MLKSIKVRASQGSQFIPDPAGPARRVTGASH